MVRREHRHDRAQAGGGGNPQSSTPKLEQRVRDRTVQLEAANQELEAFSYSVSHDLRAPLRHVQGYVDMLGREAGGQLSDKGRRYMKTIEDVSREMGVLIDDLLGFSRMGRVQMAETSVSLDELVQESIQSLELTRAAGTSSGKHRRCPRCGATTRCSDKSWPTCWAMPLNTLARATRQ